MMPFYLRWLPLAGLAVFAALVVYLLRPPQPLGADAPANEFAAGRALRDLTVIAQRPHSIGTPANAAVHDYLVQRCRELGMQVKLQDTTAVASSAFGQIAAGRVHNIVARQPGKQPGGLAVLVLAHYDSQPHTPGAGDDGAGVAAMLETMRALRAGPPLAHDIIWLFTDGEEVGLLGARAYSADTARLRREVGVALNVEARGNSGSSLTFEVNPQNGWVIQEYARAAPVPIASSLFYEAYRNLPNDTDFTPLRQAGITGLNFAFSGGFSYYHSPADTPAHLNLGSLQHQGTYVLSLVRHFGNISLAQTKGPDYTFFNPIGSWLVRYPASWNLVLTLLTAGLLLSVAAWVRRRQQLSWPGLLGGTLVWLGALLLLLVAGWGLLALVKAFYPYYQAFYEGTFYNVAAYQVALLAVGGALFTAYYGWFIRRLRPDTLVGGALLMTLVLLALLQWRAASSAFLLAFPVLFLSLAWGLRLRWGPSALADTLLALPAVALLGQTLYLLLVIFGGGLLGLLGLLVLALLLGLLLPVLLPVIGRSLVLPGVALAGSLVALVVGHLTSQPSADQPQQTHLYYALDTDQHRAYWLSAITQPDAWTRQLLTHSRYQPLPALFFGQTVPILQQGAPVLALSPPAVDVLTDSTVAGRRYLRLRLRPGRDDVRSLRLGFLGGLQLRALRLAGQRVPRANLAAQGISIVFYAPHPTGEIMEVEIAAAERCQLAVVSRSLGLPSQLRLPTLPATYVPAPGYNSFTTQVKQSFAL